MRNLARTFTLLLAVGLAAPVFADEAKPFADAKEINLLNLLPHHRPMTRPRPKPSWEKS